MKCENNDEENKQKCLIVILEEDNFFGEMNKEDKEKYFNTLEEFNTWKYVYEGKK